MILINEKLDYSKKYSKKDIILFTGNSFINNKGELVMGRGAALQVKKLYPHIPKFFGDEITLLNDLEYGVILNFGYPCIGVFQVKTHFKNKADTLLIKNSTNILNMLAKNVSDAVFHLNFPGIGYGGLHEKQVLPIIEKLPDNVRIYK